jgi:hypothetical protein
MNAQRAVIFYPFRAFLRRESWWWENIGGKRIECEWVSLKVENSWNCRTPLKQFAIDNSVWSRHCSWNPIKQFPAPSIFPSLPKNSRQTFFTFPPKTFSFFKLIVFITQHLTKIPTFSFPLSFLLNDITVGQHFHSEFTSFCRMGKIQKMKETSAWISIVFISFRISFLVKFHV